MSEEELLDGMEFLDRYFLLIRYTHTCTQTHTDTHTHRLQFAHTYTSTRTPPVNPVGQDHNFMCAYMKGCCGASAKESTIVDEGVANSIVMALCTDTHI